MLELGFLNDAPAIECRDYHTLSLNATQICKFMNTTDNCHLDDGFFDYLLFTYCDFSDNSTWLAMILLALWLLILFIALGLVADTL